MQKNEGKKIKTMQFLSYLDKKDLLIRKNIIHILN